MRENGNVAASIKAGDELSHQKLKTQPVEREAVLSTETLKIKLLTTADAAKQCAGVNRAKRGDLHWQRVVNYFISLIVNSFLPVF